MRSSPDVADPSGIVDEPMTAYASAVAEGGDKDMRVPETVIAPPGVMVWPPIVKAPLFESAVYV